MGSRASRAGDSHAATSHRRPPFERGSLRNVYFVATERPLLTWVTPTSLFCRPNIGPASRRSILSRDFVGALLQLNAEKQVSREQLVHAVEDGIQSAYRRVAGDEDIHVRIDAESGKIRVFRARVAVDEVEDP